jgi:hypothetical protein
MPSYACFSSVSVMKMKGKVDHCEADGLLMPCAPAEVIWLCWELPLLSSSVLDSFITSWLVEYKWLWAGSYKCFTVGLTPGVFTADNVLTNRSTRKSSLIKAKSETVAKGLFLALLVLISGRPIKTTSDHLKELFFSPE